MSHSLSIFGNIYFPGITQNQTQPKALCFLFNLTTYTSVSFTYYQRVFNSLAIPEAIWVWFEYEKSCRLWYVRTQLAHTTKYSFKIHTLAQKSIFHAFWRTLILFFFNLFIFGCVGSSFLCEGFLQLWQAGATLHRGARASHYRGLSCCRAQAPDAQAQQLWLTGLVAPRQVGSSQTRARTRVPCIGRQILNHCTTREAQVCDF